MDFITKNLSFAYVEIQLSPGAGIEILLPQSKTGASPETVEKLLQYCNRKHLRLEILCYICNATYIAWDSSDINESEFGKQEKACEKII